MPKTSSSRRLRQPGPVPGGAWPPQRTAHRSVPHRASRQQQCRRLEYGVLSTGTHSRRCRPADACVCQATESRITLRDKPKQKAAISVAPLT